MATDESAPSHLAQVLKSAVQLSPYPYREIEHRLALHAGALSRLLNGGTELKVRHVEKICLAIGLPPGRLWRVAYPVDEESAPEWRIAEALARLHGGAERREPAPAQARLAWLDEVERCILAALRKFFTDPAR